MGKTPNELLATMDARDFAMWAAYENVAGPVDGSFTNHALASINERLDLLNHLTGAAHLCEKPDENPIPRPQRFSRPPYFPEQEDEELDNRKALSMLDEFC